MENSAQQWERYHAGSAEAERASFDKLAKDIMDVQVKLKKKASALRIDRAFHAKPILAVTNARFRVTDNLPEELRPGTPGEDLVVFGDGSGGCLGVGRTSPPLGTSSGSFENVSDS